jgi:hypothetical protein
VDNDVEQAVKTLFQKLGNDEETTLLLAMLVASWNQLALLYQESEERHQVIVGGTSSFLSQLGQEMVRLRDQNDQAEAELKDLHDQVIGSLDLAATDIAKAKNAMKDVLKIYSDFAGNVNGLKQGIGSLVKSTIVSLNPAIGTWASPLVDKAFGSPSSAG